MGPSLKNYINKLGLQLGPELLSEEYTNSLKLISDKLPHLAFGFFECWFGECQSRVDLNIAIDRRINEHQNVVNLLAEGRLNDSLLPLEQWIQKWSNLDQQLWLFSQFLILVYDIPDPQNPNFTPWYYITYDPPSLFKSDLHFQKEAIGAILKKLDDQFLSKSHLDWELSLATKLTESRVTALGFQANRQIDALRLVLHFEDYGDICTFLQKHDWPGDINHLRAQTETLVLGCESFGLTFDVNPAMQPKIGIECFYNSQDGARNGFEYLTNKLLTARLCTAGQQKGFLEWQGSFQLIGNVEEWSSPTKSEGLINPVFAEITIKKAPKHIKVVYEPGGHVSAKGYMGFHKPFNRPHFVKYSC